MFKVASFNIRYGDAPDGPNRWEQRRALALERIQAMAPDLLGLQECRADLQADYLRAGLPEYGFYGIPRGGEASALEMTAICYRRAAFDCLDQGTLWLSETPERPGSKSWGAHFARTLTWARLRPRQAPQTTLFFFNTHFDYANDLVMLHSAACAAALIHQIAGDAPAILTGDFNCEPGSAPHAALLAGLKRLAAPAGRMAWTDALPHCGAGRGSFHAFDSLEPPTKIDWILASPGLEVTDAGVDYARRGALCPSDHDPVWAEGRFAEETSRP